LGEEEGKGGRDQGERVPRRAEGEGGEVLEKKEGREGAEMMSQGI